MEPIEIIDYIFDRYSYLNLSETASLDEIKKAIRQKRAENHPDKLIHLGDQIKAVAQRNNELIASCEQILLVPELRELFDQKLEHFQQNLDYLVSKDGHAMIDVTRFRIDISYLLSDETADIGYIETQAQQMTGYSPTKLEKTKKRYLSDVNDEDFRDDYKEALTTKLVYLNVMEDYYWQKAGVQGACQKNESIHFQSLDDLQKLFDSKVEKVSVSTGLMIEEHQQSSLLGFTAPLLLSYAGQEENKKNLNNSSTNTQALTLKAKEKFSLHLEDLKKLMAEKAQVLEELCTLTDYKIIHQMQSPMIDFFWAKKNSEGQDSLVGFGCTVNTQAKTAELFSGETPDLNNLENYPHTIYLVYPNKEIESPILELMTLVNKTLNEA